MSSPSLNPEQQKPQVVDWARLIPGEAPAFHRGKKPVQSVRADAVEKVLEMGTAGAPEKVVQSLPPGPTRNRMARRWLRLMAADFALVALNWLSIGALLVPLRVLFPHVRMFDYAAGAPGSLLGIALLLGCIAH